MTATPIPPLPSVQCPVCGYPVVLGYLGERVPFHWRRPIEPGNRRRCEGQGCRVVDGVAVPPETDGEEMPRG